jgi:polar amino acid transport system substrate-binding protein
VGPSDGGPTDRADEPVEFAFPSVTTGRSVSGRLAHAAHLVHPAYLVPAGSPVRTLDQVDAEGVRVVARPRSAYDLFLRRSLAHAELVYPADGESDVDLLADGRADALAGLRHVLLDVARGRAWPARARRPLRRDAAGDWRSAGRAAAAANLHEFVAEAKASGVVAQAIAASGAPGSRRRSRSSPSRRGVIETS